MTTARIRIAVVGTGFGARIQVPGFRASGRFEVVAIVGRNPERLQKLARDLNVPHALNSFDDALALPGLDAISIATPPDTHAAYTIAAARAGRHILCEKPMARSLAEAEAMKAAVEAAGVVGVVGYQFRFDPARAGLARLIARGDLGVPRVVTCVANSASFVAPDRPPPAWWFDAAAGGGWLNESGSHIIDALRLWLGEFAEVAAVVDTVVATRHAPGEAAAMRSDADDTFSIVFRTDGGAQGVIQQSAVTWGARYLAVRIAGSEATAWIDDRGRLFRHGRDKAPRELGVPPELLLPQVTPPADSGPFAALELGAFVRQAQRFADLIQHGTPPPDPRPATVTDGVATQRVIEALREAARTRRWVSIIPAQRELFGALPTS